MTVVNCDSIHTEDAGPVVSRVSDYTKQNAREYSHFLDDGSSSSFHTISLKNCENVVGVDLANVDQVLGNSPDGGQVGAFRNDLPL